MRMIASPNNDFIRKLKKLHEKKHRDRERMFLLEGYHLIGEAKAAGLLEQVFIVREEDFVQGVENVLVSESVIKKLAFTVSPQPIVGLCGFFPDHDLKGTASCCSTAFRIREPRHNLEKQPRIRC